MPNRTTSEFALEPPDAARLANLSGPFDAHLRQLELRLGVEIGNRGNIFRISGREAAVLAVRAGVNVELPEPDCYLHLEELVRSGALTERDLDDLVDRAIVRLVTPGTLTEETLLDSGAALKKMQEIIDAHVRYQKGFVWALQNSLPACS